MTLPLIGDPKLSPKGARKRTKEALAALKAPGRAAALGVLATRADPVAKATAEAIEKDGKPVVDALLNAIVAYGMITARLQGMIVDLSVQLDKAKKV